MNLHTTSHRVRRRLALAAVVPVVALTAACGGDEATDPASSDSSSESSGSSETPSEEAAAGEGPYDAETIIPAMEAALGDATSARIQMELKGQLAMSMDGRMAMSDDPQAAEMEMSMDIQGQTLEVRQVDGLIYLSGPPATPQGKWIEVDPNDPQDPMAQQFAGLTQTGDLRSTFDAFSNGLKEVEHVGQEEIDGQQTDHYVFTVDAAKAFEAQGQPPVDGAPETLTYDVWLDQDDLMRRVTFDLAGLQAQIDATEWGEPVEVEKPADVDLVEGPAA